MKPQNISSYVALYTATYVSGLVGIASVCIVPHDACVYAVFAELYINVLYECIHHPNHYLVPKWSPKLLLLSSMPLRS